LAADPLAGTSESAESEGAAADGAEGAPTTTAAAGGELFQAEAQTYALGPTPEGPDMDLPVVDEDALDPVGLSSALTRAATVPVDLDAVRACFPDVPAEAGALMFILTAVTPDGVIVGTVTDPDTGAQLTLTIDLTTCTVTSAG
jgi:hypothetical protein